MVGGRPSPPFDDDQNNPNMSCNITILTESDQLYKIPQIDGNNTSLLSSSSSDEVSFDQSAIMQSSFYSSSSSSALTNSFEKSWFSQVSECDAAQPNPVPDNHISVIIGHRPNKVLAGRQQAVRRVIRRENKCIEALSLPIILSYNMRSIWEN